jgi:hypothetical protein
VVDLTKVEWFDLAVVRMFEATAVAAEGGGGTLSLRCACQEGVADLTAGGLARLVRDAGGPPTNVDSAPERATSRRDHPAGSALPNPDQGVTGRSKPAPHLRRIQ